MPCNEEPFDKQQSNNDILMYPVVMSDPNVVHSIHTNFFNNTINDSNSRPCINDTPITNTQILDHTLYTSLLKIKRGNADNSIEHYNACWCKFRQVEIYNPTDQSEVQFKAKLSEILNNLWGALLEHQI